MTCRRGAGYGDARRASRRAASTRPPGRAATGFAAAPRARRSREPAGTGARARRTGRAAPTASALSSPAATSQTSSAALDGRQGQGEPGRRRLRAAAYRGRGAARRTRRASGEDRRHVAVLAHAEHQHVERGRPWSSAGQAGQLGRVRSAAASGSSPTGPSDAGIGCTRAGSSGSASSSASRAWVRCAPGRRRAGTARRPTTRRPGASRPRRVPGGPGAPAAPRCRSRRRSARPTPSPAPPGRPPAGSPAEPPPPGEQVGVAWTTTSRVTALRCTDLAVEACSIVRSLWARGPAAAAPSRRGRVAGPVRLSVGSCQTCTRVGGRSVQAGDAGRPRRAPSAYSWSGVEPAQLLGEQVAELARRAGLTGRRLAGALSSGRRPSAGDRQLVAVGAVRISHAELMPRRPVGRTATGTDAEPGRSQPRSSSAVGSPGGPRPSRRRPRSSAVSKAPREQGPPRRDPGPGQVGVAGA